MIKKFMAMVLAGVMSLGLVACSAAGGPSTAPAPTGDETQVSQEASKDYKIGIITGTVSQGEEEYRQAENMKAKYGDMIVTATYPDNFMKEQETTISQVLSVASDPQVKALIILQAVPGTSAAIDKVREKRPDMLVIAGVPGEDPAMIASKADMVLQADELGMGKAIAEQAKAMGAKTLVHYSFPRHMSYEMISKRREIMKATCEELGIQFVDATAPDPTGDAGVPGAQQFILEDVPRKISEFGTETAFFNTNCAMQEPLIKSILDQGAIFPQQCCPSPFHGYPGALGIEIPEDKKGDVNYIVEQITAKVAEKNGTGKFSTWPIPVNMLFVEAGVEYAMAYCEGKTEKSEATKDGKNDQKVLKEIMDKIVGSSVQLSTYEVNGQAYDNYHLLLSDYIKF